MRLNGESTHGKHRVDVKIPLNPKKFVVEELRNEDAEKFYDALLRLPKNRKSFPEYAGRAYGGETYSGRGVPAARRRDTASANKIFGRVRGLLEFPVTRGHLSREQFGAVVELADTYFKGYSPELLKREFNQVQFGSAPSNRHGQGQVACMQANDPRNNFNTPIGTL